MTTMQPTTPPAGNLREFQDQFARALLDPAPASIDAGAVAGLVAQPGFAVYRNTVLKGCVDALQANYPAVTRLVGEEWMRAAATVYARTHLPATPMLLDYGAGFAAFLATFAPAAELPYLAGVARLDRLWTEAHAACDARALEPDAIGGMSEDQLAQLVLRVHPSARWMWFDEQPIFTIWSRNRDDREADRSDADDIAWQGEGALIVRPFDRVQWMPVGSAEIVFLDQCAAGGSLARAATAALEAEPSADLAQLMARLLTAGAFAEIAHERIQTGELP